MSSLTVVRCLEQEVGTIEDRVREAGRAQPGYALLQTIPGIGPILAGTILLEAGDMQRFATVGHFASYCRCVGSEHVSNGKRKGAGNTKNGNKYLRWAFIEAAHFAIRYEAVIRTYYQRKQARTHPLVALKAVAHKLARACYHSCASRSRSSCPVPSADRDQVRGGAGSSQRGWGATPHSRLAPVSTAVLPAPRAWGLRRLGCEP